MKRWTDVEIKQLMQIMHKFGVKKGETKAAKKFGRSAHACYSKYMELKKKEVPRQILASFGADTKRDYMMEDIEAQFQAASAKQEPEVTATRKTAMLRNAKLLAQTNDILVLQENERVIVYNI